MEPQRKDYFIGVDDYLAGELGSPIKHEYIGGRIYAMAGASTPHNRIASNLHGLLHAALRGQRCEAFTSDMKVRIRLPTHVRFYYPDVTVVCRSNPQEDAFQDQPTVIFEILSPDTRRTDEGEKKEYYLSISSLTAYALLEQDSMLVVVYRRTDDGFVRESYEGADATLSFPDIGLNLSLRDIYERVESTGT